MDRAAPVRPSVSQAEQSVRRDSLTFFWTSFRIAVELHQQPPLRYRNGHASKRNGRSGNKSHRRPSSYRPIRNETDQTMALATPAMRIASGSSILPRLLSHNLFSARITRAHYRFSLSFLPSIAIGVPAIQLGLPSLGSLLGDIWESVLKAVPKKKTSHSKKRHRQLAGKALKDVTNLCKCPACGETKRMHHLCPHCVKSKLCSKTQLGGSMILTMLLGLSGLLQKELERGTKESNATTK